MYTSYIKFEGFNGTDKIEGECTDADHKGWSELYSFSWGISNYAAMGSNAQGLVAGKADFSKFRIDKAFDKASVFSAMAVAKGAHINKCTVDICLIADGTQHSYIQYIFEDCLIDSVGWSGGAGAGDRPSETMFIAFSKATWQYTPINDKGKPESGNKVGPVTWDLKTNKA